MTAGARIYDYDFSADSNVIQRGAHRDFSGSDDAIGVSPKIALSYRSSDAITLFASLSQGYRVGGFNTAGPLGTRFDGLGGNPARQYSSDRLWTYEVGAKGDLWSGRVDFRASAYGSRWLDIQSDQFLPSGLGYVVNVGDGRDAGAEIEANWRIDDAFSLRVNAMVADPGVTRPSAAFNARPDQGLPGVPKSAANASLRYDRSVWGGRRFSATADLAYVGGSTLTFDAAQSLSQGNYTRARLTASLEGARWSASAFIDNALDTEANTFAFSDPFRLNDAQAITPLRPITAGVDLRWRFAGR